MRTTLTLDDDVAALVEKAAKKRGTGIKAVINEALRDGLPRLLEPPAKPKQPYRIRTFKGKPLIRNLDNVEETLDHLEGPLRR